MSELSQIPLTALKGIGSKVAEKFLRLNISNCKDLLFHLPSSYEDRTKITPIAHTQNGQKYVLQGFVNKQYIGFRKTGKNRRMLVVTIQDDTGQITVRLFHFNASQQQQLSEGNEIRLFGEVTYLHSIPEMAHPEFQVIENGAAPALEQTLTPVYPTTEGVHQRSVRNALMQVLAKIQQQPIADPLPHAWLCQQNLPDLNDALLSLHQPPNWQQSQLIQHREHPAQTRLIIEELAIHHALLLDKKQQQKKQHTALYRPANLAFDEFEHLFPFALTTAQKRVCHEIINDLIQPFAMMRLLQGDVGAGKTVIAAFACLSLIRSGYQAILMAPTEILAEQHMANFTAWFTPLKVNTVLLTGSDKGKQRAQKEQHIEQGKAQMIIGTHALFHSKANFHNPGMIVIDEQHRFGVAQRQQLLDKGLNGLTPHHLIMTATPIPRTLALSFYADLDYSQLDELPPGRTPIKTSVIAESQRPTLINSVKNACQQHKQIYWVCTLIEESEALQCQTAEDTFAKLSQQLAPFKVGLVHGRMKGDEKEHVIQQFKQQEIQVLVATTVIEVGVDVPNASIMVIENAERLGLSQIHQLRGRVGRGNIESFCLLLVSEPLSQTAKQRLSILKNSNDGFKIAEKDLQIRGAGELLGTRQSGGIQLKIADLNQDSHLLQASQNLGDLLQQPQYSEAKNQLSQHWLGQKQQFTTTA